MKRDLTPIYLEAAMNIEVGKEEYSCNAINRITGQRPAECSARALYSCTMKKPEEVELRVQDIRDAVDNFSFSKAARDLRVLLLCMMAACWQDME